MGVYKLSANSVSSGRTIYGSMLAGNTAFVPYLLPTSYDSIATTTVGSGGSSSVTFSSIPSTYTHLQVRALIRLKKTSDDYLTTTFNSSTAVTARHRLSGDGSTASAGGGSGTGQDFGPYPNASQTASVFGVLILDILDYTNTNKYKTYRFLNGYDLNGSGQIYFQSTTAASTNAITEISFSTYYGDGYAQYSHFALYGVKGA